VLLILFILLAITVQGSPSITVNFTSSTTWVVPAGVNSLIVEAWGGGGAGGGGIASYGGGGGAGGQYAKKTFNVSSGQNYTITVAQSVAGTVNAGTSGANTSLNASVIARGGTGGCKAVNPTCAAVNGTNSSGVGDIVYAGGNGGGGTGSSGGGGGGAGTTGRGGNASGTAAGNGTILFGGNGATGLSGNGAGSSGSNYSGGGSGGRGNNNAGGNGAPGYLRITYYPPNNIPNATLNNPQNNSIITFSPVLNVTCKDGDSESCNITFINASNNAVICFNTSISNNNYALCSININNNEELKWFVNLTDGFNITSSGIWNFTYNSPTFSFSVSYPNSGCSEGDGCSTPGCTVCTYCSVKFPYLPYSNLNCTGQTDAVSFYVINNDGNMPINIESKLNQTILNAFFKLSLASNPFDSTAKIINTSYQTITQSQIPASNSEEIWGFGNATGTVPKGNYSLNLSMHCT
jgi:hypothetical protein